MDMNFGAKISLALVMSFALFASACGGDTDDDATVEESSSETEGAATQNACPAEGCTIDFGELSKSGDEIEVTWVINFDPDINNNHIHIYWNNFTAAQVSNDATDRNVAQGEWVPTDTAPSYVTSGAVSTSVRGASTTLCLVAADRDHNVIDEGTEVCKDVSDLL